MLRYCWNDFMIAGQMGGDRIVIDAVPTNVRNISGEEEGIQHIEKAFQGEITVKLLNKEIGQEWKHLRNIEKMYEYFCSCINQAEKMRTGQIQASNSMQRILVSRQWCKDQGNSHKKQRLIVKILLSNTNGPQVKQEQPEYFVVKLKEVYLTINGLLLKCNTLVLSELDYLRQMEDRQTEKMNELYRKMQEQMKQQLDLHKQELKNMIQSMFKLKDKTREDTSSTKQKTSKKKHQATSKEIKYQEETSFQLKKQNKKRHKTLETLSQIKSETQIKYEQDQQGLRLKLLQQSQPQKVIQIPIQFDQDNPAYHFFLFSDKSAKKMGGFDYPMAILKHIIPQQGTHGVIINYAQQKSRRLCCIQIGIIDQNIKKLLHSSVSDNYVFFKFNISSVCTKINGVEKKKRFKRLRVLIPGESVELRVNLRLGIISWTFSYGVTIRSEIPPELRKMNMQPFVGIFTTGDMVRFQDYPTPPE